MNPAAGIALTVLLLALNAFFVAAEFALVAARRTRIEPQAQAGSKRAARTLRSMEHLSLMLAGAQLGITVCSLALGAVSEPAIAHLLEPVFHAMHVPDGVGHAVSFALALLLVTALHVVLGEMVPKNVTLAMPDTAALWLSGPLSAIVKVFRPLIWALNATTNLLLRLARVDPKNEVNSTITAGEFAGVVAESRREGLLEAGDHDLVSSALSLETMTVADVSLPIADVHVLPPAASATEVEQLAARTGVTRFPVGAGGDLVGYVHLKDTLKVPRELRDAPLPPEYLRRLPSVRADLTLTDCAEVLRQRKAHLARVVGAGGYTVGVITLDDILAGLAR